jgi:hypothetical protein
MSHRQITLGGGLVPSAASDAVVELAGLQRPGDLVKTEDDAGRHCFRADELERAWRVRNTDPSLDCKTRHPSNYRFGANCRRLGRNGCPRSCKDPFVRPAEDPSGTGRPPVGNVSPRVCGYSRTRRAHKSAVVKPTSKYGHITTRSPTLVTALIPPSWDRMNATEGSIFSTKRNAERWRVP